MFLQDCEFGSNLNIGIFGDFPNKTHLLVDRRLASRPPRQFPQGQPSLREIINSTMGMPIHRWVITDGGGGGGHFALLFILHLHQIG